MNRKQIRHWSLIEMECWPFRSSFSACSRFPGGTLRSSSFVARSTYSSFRTARAAMSDGNRFAFPLRNRSRVRRSANVLITVQCTVSRDACQSALGECRLTPIRLRCYAARGMKTEIPLQSNIKAFARAQGKCANANALDDRARRAVGTRLRGLAV